MEKQLLASLFLLATFFLGSSYGQANETCRSTRVQFTPRHRLNISAYMGTWYIHETGSSDIGVPLPAPDRKCARQYLTLPDAGDIRNIDVIDIFVNTTTDISTAEYRTASINNTFSPFSAMWTLTGGQQQTTDFIILFTDLEYAEWTVVYSCSVVGPDSFRHEYTLAMTRSRTIDPTLRRYLKALMVSMGSRITHHQSIDQTNC